MQYDLLRTKWKQFRNEINHQWKQLTAEEVERVEGRRDNLVVLLERRYGYARRRAEQEVDLIVAEFADKLRKAS
jgi:uncharacterized protein YjbJ (UPF0337 family)